MWHSLQGFLFVLVFIVAVGVAAYFVSVNTKEDMNARSYCLSKLGIKEYTYDKGTDNYYCVLRGKATLVPRKYWEY